MQIIRIAIASVLALGLMLGITLPAMAAPETAPVRAFNLPSDIVRGTVSDVGDGYFVVQSNGDELTITVDDNTTYYKLDIPEGLKSSCRSFTQFQNRIREKAKDCCGLGNVSGIQECLRDRIRDCARNGLKLQCPFASESEFSDIDVGDKVIVFLADGTVSDYLAERVVIISPLSN